jgi:flavin prenyltransferase
MPCNELVLAMTGASGSRYGLRLLEVLLRVGHTVHFVISPAGAQVLQQEEGKQIHASRLEVADLLGFTADAEAPGKVHFHDYRDFQAGIASGSFLTGGMVVCPCSMGTAAAIAHGLSQNLIHRAADVHLKERRKLILVPRETPLSVVQLRNLTLCAEAGAVVLPAMPAFYTKPQSLADAVDFIVGRICDQLGVEHELLRRWGH